MQHHWQELSPNDLRHPDNPNNLAATRIAAKRVNFATLFGINTPGVLRDDMNILEKIKSVYSCRRHDRLAIHRSRIIYGKRRCLRAWCCSVCGLIHNSMEQPPVVPPLPTLVVVPTRFSLFVHLKPIPFNWCEDMLIQRIHKT
jgi:hypothetical protein